MLRERLMLSPPFSEHPYTENLDAPICRPSTSQRSDLPYKETRAAAYVIRPDGYSDRVV
jgi:hypothetical protein